MPGLKVRIEQGELEGTTKSTDDGVEYCCYYGIPFAKPPLGQLRFQDPQEPEPWDGVWNATCERSICAQMDLVITKDLTGSEDCLFVNVNVPSSASEDSRLPVMVFVHGGGFRMGSGNSSTQGPDYFMRKDVVFVTFNYRLGPLGFLCMNSADAPGNAGLKDQVMALKWVQKNIAKFGGDPDNVTIFGESAGAASVHYLMMSPMAKGLFSACIMQSGSCAGPWAIQKNPVFNVLDLARDLGCETKSREKALGFLRDVYVKDLVTASHTAYSLPGNYCYLPVIESKIPGVEAFITKNPLELMKTGDYNKVPCIMGWNSVEGAVYLSDIFLKIENFNRVRNFEQLKVDFKALIKQVIKANDGKDVERLSLKIREFYFKKDRSFVDGFVDMIGDMHFAKDANTCINLMSSHSPVYFYVMSYDGDYNLGKTMTKYEYKGASHGDDLSYLFKLNLTGVELPPMNADDRKFSDKLVTLWTNFAKFGNPTPDKNDVITEIWTTASPDASKCLDIDKELKMMDNPFRDRAQFWEDLLSRNDIASLRDNFKNKMDFWNKVQKP